MLVNNYMQVRKESDSFGIIEVPGDKYWGAQTQRSLENFKIGYEKMPKQLLCALGVLKKAAALTNVQMGVLDPSIGEVIIRAAEEVIEGKLDDHCPLAV